MEWIEALKDELEDEALDFTTPATILRSLFQNIIHPTLSVDPQGRLVIPEVFTVKVGGSKAISSLLSHPKVFLAIPVLLQKIILDVLFVIVHRESYDIVRLQYLDDLHAAVNESCSLNRHLLKLYVESISVGDSSVSKRILLLLGHCASIGITLHELKRFLSFLKTPSELSLSLLQSLHSMLPSDLGASKSRPQSIFNFSGPGSGIVMKNVAFPFPKEYQICLWFRVESFEENMGQLHDSHPIRAFDLNDNAYQHIITWKNQSRKGLDIYIEKCCLVVAISHTSKAEPILLKLSSHPLKKGVWYHLSIRHAKPKMTFFSKDELEVCLDHEVVCNENIRYPNLGNSTDVDFVVGHNFDGQTGPIYFFNEALPAFAMQAVARIDAGRSVDGSAAVENNAADLAKHIIGPDRRPFQIAAKLVSSYHPTRCSNGRCIDIHSGNHGYMGRRTFPWNFTNPRDVLPSLGGILCLLPLFPKLLIENENVEKYNSAPDVQWGVGLGTSIALTDNIDDELNTVYDRTTFRSIETQKEDFYGVGAISCLISIIARAISNSAAFQDQLLVSGGVEMIESALQCVPHTLVIDENEKCVWSLLQLKEAAIFSESLQLKVSKLLLSNTALWASAGSYTFLSSLLSVILSLIKNQPAISAAIVDIRNLLDTIGMFENLREENVVRSRMNSVASLPSLQSPQKETGTETSSPGKQISFANPSSGKSNKVDDIYKSNSTEKPTGVSFEGLAPTLVTSEDREYPVPPPLHIVSPKLHQPLSAQGSTTHTPTLRFSTASSPARKTPRSSNPNQTLIASLRKMKSFKLALSETLQDELEDEMSSPSNDMMMTPGNLSSIQELTSLREEDDDEDQGEGSVGKVSNASSNSRLKRPFSTESIVGNNKKDKRLAPLENPDNQYDATADAATPESNFLSPYNSSEKKLLREYIGSIVAELLFNNPEEESVLLIVDFVASCKDAVVLVELINVLVYLMSRSGSTVANHLVSAYQGVEEFVAYTIVFLIHQPNEELRCAAIHLLAMFTLHLESLSPQVLVLSTRKGKKQMAKAALDGMNRLRDCGSLALLCEVLSSHCPTSSQQTYRALLTLLLRNNGALNACIRNFSVEPKIANVNAYQSIDRTQSTGSGIYPVNPILFDPDHDDEDGDVVDLLVLPLFLELLPKFPVSIHDQMYSDLLSLVKHSPGVRTAFCACPSWHLCMFGLVLELLDDESGAIGGSAHGVTSTFKIVYPVDILDDMQSRAPSSVTNSPLMQFRRRSSSSGLPGMNSSGSNNVRKSSGGKLEVELLRRWKSNSVSSTSRNSANSLRYSANISAPDYRFISDMDMNFDLGMKIYSTLLLHALEKKLGWKEIDQSISPSFESEKGYLIAQCILSHLLNEITFTLQSRHKELRRLKRSNSIVDQQTGDCRLKNLLSTMLTASQVALIDQNCVMGVIPFPEVCRQRVHYFYDMQQEMEASTPKSIESIDKFQELDPVDQQHYLDEVELRLRRHFLRTGSNGGGDNDEDNNDDVKDPEALNGSPRVPVQESLDLTHTWYDMNSSSSTRFTGGSFSQSMSQPSRMENSPAILSDKPLEELLHPLERIHDAKSGKLTLVLQALRIFDTLCWENSEADFTDLDLLGFSKEGSQQPQNQSQQSSQTKSNNNSGDNPKPVSIYLSIYSALVRMSLFALNSVSPTNAVSVLTIKRLRVAITSIERMPLDSTPTTDWLLVVIVHITLHLQRLMTLLEPALALIGIRAYELRVNTFGPWESQTEEVECPPQDHEDALLQALRSEETLKMIEDYFDTSVGNNLVRNIRQSIRLLFDVKRLYAQRIAQALEDRCYRAFQLLLQQVQEDLQDELNQNPPSEQDSSTLSAAAVTGGMSSAMSADGEDTLALPSAAFSPLTPGGLFSANSFRGRMMTQSVDSDNGRGSSVDYTSNNNYDSVTESSKNNSVGIKTPATPATPFLSRDQPLSSAAVEYLETVFNGTSIVLMMKWLLSPYFRMNLLRSVPLIKALDKLDNLEAKAVAKFSIETRLLKDTLEEHRDLAIKSVGEMAELKALSREVHEKLIDRNKQKRSQINAQNMLKTKNIAARWHDCIQRFEDDWSPWTTLDESKQQSPGSSTPTKNVFTRSNSSNLEDNMRAIAHFQLSKHRDNKLRNMLLTKLPEPIDHRDAAHLESKLKDQLHYLQSHAGSVPTDVPASQTALASSMNNSSGAATKPALPIKFTPLAFAANNRNSSNNSGNNSGNGHTSHGLDSATASAAAAASLSSESNKHNQWAELEDGDDDESNDVKQTTSLTAFSAGDLINPLGFFTMQERRPAWTHMFSWASDEKALLVMDANQIQLDQVIAGSVLLSNKCLYFHCKKRLGGLAQASKPFVDRKYHLDRLVEAYGRRYLLQNSAVELFFADSPELFLAFKTSKELQKFFRVLKNQATPLLMTSLYLNPIKLFRNSKYTEMWRRRLISNFEYLMRLNVLAGRSYNDITQYPVFPWVIADYESAKLDLQNPKSFRPLHLPVGALNKERLKDFCERFKTFDDDQVPKFMYGSHYSSAGVVLHYMVRQEPFTTLAINLQSGRFDVPDRIFFDIKRTWQGCNNSMSDVKEMIPELYCCPEILLNTNRLPLGELQEGGIVDDVILPPWAKDAFDFIRINREALESDYVSEHLHEWIDLIFGYKQKGIEAEKAFNVFYYLTYENAINIEAIDDPLQREAAKAQVTHFGQTPSQLLNKEHPRRLPKSECLLPLCHSRDSVHKIKIFTPAGSLKQTGRHQQHGAIIAMQCMGERLIVLHEDGHVCYYRWTAFLDIDGSPFTIRSDRQKALPSVPLAYAENLLKGLSAIRGNSQQSAGSVNADDVRRGSNAALSVAVSDATADQADSEDARKISSDDPAISSTPVETIVSPSRPVSQSSQNNSLFRRLNTFRFGATANAAADSDADSPVVPAAAQTATGGTDDGNKRSGMRRTGSLYGAALAAGQSLSSSLRNQTLGSSGSNNNSSSDTPQSEESASGIIGRTPRYYGKLVQPVVGVGRSALGHRPSTSALSSSSSAGAATWTPLANMTHRQVALSPAGGRLVSCGYWDHAVKLHALDTLKELGSVSGGHRGVVTTLAMGDDGHLLVSGGMDGCLRVWVIEKPSLALALTPEAFHSDYSMSESQGSGHHHHHTSSVDKAAVAASLSNAGATGLTSGSMINAAANSSSSSSSLLSSASPLIYLHTMPGHASPLTALSYSSALDLVLSGDSEGLLCIHTVRQGHFVRSLRHMVGASIDVVLATTAGYLLAHSASTLRLSVSWLNGQVLRTEIVDDRIECMVCSESASSSGSPIVICGTQQGHLVFRDAATLCELHRLRHLEAHGGIRYLGFTEDEQFLLIGCRDGSYSIACDPDSRRQLLNSALQMTPLLG